MSGKTRKARSLLDEGFHWAAELGLPLPGGWERVLALSLAQGEGAPASHLAAACAAFYLFRCLHQGECGPERVLLGDLFFSLFSTLLIPLDSVWLAEEFSRRLTRGEEGDYLDFVRRISRKAGGMRDAG